MPLRDEGKTEMTLTIPERYKESFANLVRMRPEELEALKTAVSHAHAKSSIFAFVSELAEKSPAGLNFHDLHPLFGMLGSLARLLADEVWSSAQEFVGELIRAAKAENLRPSDGDWDRLSQALAAFFASDSSLAITSKASELLSENERRLCAENCRVLTDLRPIFPRGAIGHPNAAVLQHILKIAYHDNTGEVREFYVALDSDDLRQLRNILERAVAKEASLGQQLRQATITVVGSESEDA